MAEQVKIVAEFEDKASAGIKKVNEAIGELSNKSSNSGIGGLGEAIKGLGQHFQGLTSGSTGAIESVRGLASSASTAATSLGGLGATAATAVGAVAAVGAATVAVYAGLEKIAWTARDAADASSEMADKLGVSIERLEVLKVVASENGTSVEALQRTFDKISRSMQKLDDDTAQTEYAFESLGLSMKELAGKSEQEIAGIVIKNWEDLGRSTKATAAVQQLLGMSFRDQVPAIKEMSTRMAEYEERVRKFGSEATPDIIAAGGRQEQATTDLGLAWKGLANEVSRWTGEMMTNIMNWAATALKGIKDVMGEMRQARDMENRVQNLPDETKRRLFMQAREQADKAGERFPWQIQRRYMDLSRDEVRRQMTEEEDASSETQRLLNRSRTQQTDELRRRSDAAVKPEKDKAASKDEFKEALIDLERQLSVTRDTSVEEKVLFETQKGRFKNFSDEQKKVLLGIAKQIDLRNDEEQISETIRKAEQKDAEEQIRKEERRKEVLRQIQEQAANNIRNKQSMESDVLTLQEYELTLTGMTAEERARLLAIKKEELQFQRESKNLTEEELEAAKKREEELSSRRDALRGAAKEAATVNSIMDQSQERIQQSVSENLMIAKRLLDERKINLDDYVKYQNSQLERLGMKTQEVTDEWTMLWQEAAKNTQNIMADFFFDAMQGKMTNLADSFKTMLDRMVAQALAAQLGNALFGADFGKKGQLGGWVGQGMNLLGSLFAGGRATGGDVMPGKMYMVGENGPEPFIPKVAGTILPNSSLKTMSSNAVTNVNISAVDAHSFRSMLERDPRFITDLVHKTSRTYNMGF